LQCKSLLDARTARASLAVFLVAGLLGLWYGHVVVSRQRTALAASPALQAEQHAAVFRHVAPTATAADQLYYLYFHTRHEPGAWAPFALGLRDVQPYNLKIRLLALHGQLYAGELVNPLLVAAGHFDAAFVLAWLSPLLVIALLHPLWAEERESGTWALVRAQAASPWRLLGITWAVRVAFALLPCLVLIGAAVVWWRLPLDGRVATVVALTVAHVLFWSGVALLVVARGYSSQVNALVLVGAWLLLALVGPGLVTTAVSARHPLPQALELTLRQRQGYHAAWDRPLTQTMADFDRQYPAFAGASEPTTTYSNAWYYAMQQAGDDAAAPAAQAYLDALERRRQASRVLARAFPPAAFQLAMNQVARTDLDSHLGYLQSVATYHEGLKRLFLPAIFDGRTVESVDWTAVPRHGYRDARAPEVTGALVTLWGAALAALGLGAWALARAVRHEA
jgi:ABC-2 type transport system permease protein